MNQGERIEKGIVLRAINYQESDKILTIFTADEGKIVAKLKSCRQPKAKLKFAGQPFCFAEWTLVQKGEHCIVANALEIESFFDISLNYDKLIVASCLLEMCDYVLNPEEPSGALFVELLKCLKMLANKNYRFDIIFLDPPYKTSYGEQALTLIKKFNLLNNNGTLIFEHEKDKTFDFCGFDLFDKKTYGIKQVSFFTTNDDEQSANKSNQPASDGEQ